MEIDMNLYLIESKCGDYDTTNFLVVAGESEGDVIPLGRENFDYVKDSIHRFKNSDNPKVSAGYENDDGKEGFTIKRIGIADKKYGNGEIIVTGQ